MFDLGAWAAAFIGGLLTYAFGGMLGAVESALRKIPVVGELVADAFSAIAQTIVGILQSLWRGASDLIGPILGAIYQGWRRLFDSLLAWAHSIETKLIWLATTEIPRLAQAAAGDIIGLVRDLVSKVEWLVNEVQRIQAFIQGLEVWVLQEVKRGVEFAFSELMTTVINPLVSKVESISHIIEHDLETIIHDAVHGVSSLLSAALDQLEARIKNLEELLKAIPGLDELLKLIESIWPWLASDNVITFLKWLWKIDQEILGLIDPATWLGFNPGIGSELGKNLARSGSGFESVLRDIYGVKRRT